MAGFQSYKRYGHRCVSGWLESEVLTILAVLNSAQRAKKTTGAVAEIGVHHGKLLIGLHLLQGNNEKSVAIDVFGSQELNIDKSGRGNLAAFHRNVKRWSPSGDIVIYQGDSTRLQPEELRKLAGADIRLFSVDGGHTASIVYSDMKLAEATLSADGIVVADDVFNELWPGVSIGTFRYLEQGGELLPFAVGFNKVFFAKDEYVEDYRNALKTAFRNRILTSARIAEFGKHEVVIIARVPRRPERLAGRIGVIRAIRRLYQERRENRTGH